MKRSNVIRNTSTGEKRLRPDENDDFYDIDEDQRLQEFIDAASGRDFYDSDEDRRLSDFAVEIEQHKADDDFVALYDGWEEDMEEVVIIPDEGDAAPFAVQQGGFQGFDSSEEDEDAEPEVEEDAGMPADLQQYYDFVQSRRRWVKKFGVVGYATQFCLKNLERIDDIMQLLEDIIQLLIDQATHTANRE